MNPRDDRTALRLKLLANGFEPLANKSKLCVLPEWSTFPVTEERIRSWHRSRAFADTGIRCGDVIAIDFDIDDETLLNQFADILVAEGIVEETPFVRIGRPPREMWIYRAVDKIGKRTSGIFISAGADPIDPDTPRMQVEVLGRGCQFGAYGQHSDAHQYQWPDQGLLDHDLTDLPPITLPQAEGVIARAAAFFEAGGWERRTTGGGTDEGFTRVYDLTPEMTFDTKENGTLTLDELEALLAASPETDLRVHVDSLRPTSGSWAGVASYVQGSVCINDYGEYKAHFPASLDLGTEMFALGQLLEQRRPKPTTSDNQPVEEVLPINAHIGWETALGNALKRFAFISGGSQVADLVENRIAGLQNFRDTYTHIYRTVTGKGGADKIIKLPELWATSADRIMTVRAEMRPDQPWPIFVEGRDKIVNTYRPPDLPTSGDARVGHEMLAYLIPIPEERHWFRQWLGYKLCHPAVRGPAVFMIADNAYGTGRGSLIRLMRTMFGHNMVRDVDFQTLTGKTYQSQYNEFMSDSLIVAVNEAREIDSSASRWQQRSNAYEHLKGLIDPADTRMRIARKGDPNFEARVFASMFVASNHSDALAIPLNDRRIAVIENGLPAPQEFWARFNAWLANEANVGAFAADLMATDMTGYNPYVAPPMTGIKLDMIRNGESDIDRAMEWIVKLAPGALMTKEQAQFRMYEWLDSNAADMPENWEGVLNIMFKRLTRSYPMMDRLTIDGKQRTIRQIRAPTRPLTTKEAVLEEVMKNGPLSHKAGDSGGKVIDFSTGRPRL